MEVITELEPSEATEIMQSDFTNDPNPNQASLQQQLLQESIVITGLQEFVSYSFEVTVETMEGPNVGRNTPQDCNTTQQDGGCGQCMESCIQHYAFQPNV